MKTSLITQLLTEYEKIQTKCKQHLQQLMATEDPNAEALVKTLEEIIQIDWASSSSALFASIGKERTDGHEEKAFLMKKISDLQELDQRISFKLERKKIRADLKIPIHSILNHPHNQCEIPQYLSCPESSVQKLGRIQTFVKKLTASMLQISHSMETDFQMEDFLRNEPLYLKAKQKVQTYRMRNEDILAYIENQANRQVSNLLRSSYMGQNRQLQQYMDKKDIPQNGFHTYKIPKRNISNAVSLKQVIDDQARIIPIEIQRDQSEIQMIRARRTSFNRQKQMRKKQEQEAATQRVRRKFVENQIPLQQSSKVGGEEDQNFVYMVRKKTPDGSRNSSFLSINSLRSKRKKVFDDDVWDELQKL